MLNCKKRGIEKEIEKKRKKKENEREKEEVKKNKEETRKERKLMIKINNLAAGNVFIEW